MFSCPRLILFLLFAAVPQSPLTLRAFLEPRPSGTETAACRTAIDIRWKGASPRPMGVAPPEVRPSTDTGSRPVPSFGL